VKRLKNPKQNWYLTGTKLVNGRVVDGLYPDFIFIGGMISGNKFQLKDLNPVKPSNQDHTVEDNCNKEDRTDRTKEE